MTTDEINETLTEAVLSMNPETIRRAGIATGHPIYEDLTDDEIRTFSAQIVLFFMHKPPEWAVIKALNHLGLRSFRFSGFNFGNKGA